jgi:hypothetical protein
MTKWYAIRVVALLFAAGCAESRSSTPPVVLRTRTVTVSGDDPLIDMGDGTRLAVDGVPAGKTMQFKLTQYRDSSGRIGIDVDTDSGSVCTPSNPDE